jgi:hypothetical protein
MLTEALITVRGESVGFSGWWSESSDQILNDKPRNGNAKS